MRKLQFVEQNCPSRLKILDNPLFNSIYEDSHEAIFFLESESFKIIDCNKKAVEFFQVENKSDLLNLDFFSLYSNKPIEFSRQFIKDEICNGLEFSQELSFSSFKTNPFRGKLTQKLIKTADRNIVISRINKVIEYGKSSYLLNTLIKQTSKISGEDFLNVLGSLLSDVFEVKYVIIAQIKDEERKFAETVKFWSGNTYRENFIFDIPGSPNSNVVNGYITYYHKMLPELFTGNNVFNKLRVESYLGVPIFAKNGNVNGMIILMDDKPIREKPNVQILSIFAPRVGAELERIKAEEQLRINSEKFISEKNFKDKLIQIVAHDLKNPFNSIIGYTDLLKTRFTDFKKDKIKEIIDIIHFSTKSCDVLINDLIAWPAAQNGTTSLNIKRLNFSGVIDKLFELFTYTAKNKDIKLINLIDDKFELNCDEIIIMIILRNLLSNAIKFSFHNSEIKVSAISQNDIVFISVEDSGSGLSKDEVEKILSENIVSTPGTDNEQGHGLGMLLCREFVGLHNGTMHIESNKNSGTKVTFSIPQ